MNSGPRHSSALKPQVKWTREMEESMRQKRAMGLVWEDIARTLGLSRNAVVARAKRIGLSATGSKTPQSILPPAQEREIRRGSDPLPAGNSHTWSMINRGTILESSVWDAVAEDLYK